jgi:ubiquinone/menaquinone biosynthesis C-methylase UbiE
VDKATIQTQWENAAPGWAKWESATAEWAEPATQAMLELAGIAHSIRVLDIACGAGSQTITAARIVGTHGHVIASDISETMLQHVRENVRTARLQNVSTLQGAADELAIPPESVDAAICRLGLMLFPDPKNALKCIHRALKPGGKVAVVVFSTPAANPHRAKAMQILLRHAGKPPPAEGQPGMYALGGTGIMENLYQECGFTDTKRRELKIPMVMQSAADALQMMQDAYGAYRAVLRDCSAEIQKAAWDEVSDMLKTFEKDGKFIAPSELLVAAATKPHAPPKNKNNDDAITDAIFHSPGTFTLFAIGMARSRETH